MTDTKKTYCTNKEVESRLALGDHYAGEIDQVRNVRERAHRWIKQKFAHFGLEAPEPDEELDDEHISLIDIEADRAAYYYLRDVMEWATEPTTAMKKRDMWKEDSEEKLKDLLRALAGDDLWGFRDEK